MTGSHTLSLEPGKAKFSFRLTFSDPAYHDALQMNNISKEIRAKHDEFALEKKLMPLFRQQCIIPVEDKLIDPKGFNLKEVPGRLYKIFQPIFTAEQLQLARLLSPDYPAIYFHLLAVRMEAYDIEGEEYLFIRGYRVGHTLESETIVLVVKTQVKGGCHVIAEDGHIGGDGKGSWYAVLCPPETESDLLVDLKAEEARRRKLLPKCLFRKCAPTEEVDTSEI